MDRGECLFLTAVVFAALVLNRLSCKQGNTVSLEHAASGESWSKGKVQKQLHLGNRKILQAFHSSELPH